MYIPNPIRCRKCLRFGHFADKCSKDAICASCSKPVHDGSPCGTFVPTCVNCNQNHSSLDVKCPRFLEEKEIKTIQFREKIPYNAAKRMYKESSSLVTNKSYAAIVRSKRCVEVSCQTDDSNIPPAVVLSTASTFLSSSSLPVSSTTSPPLPLPILPSPHSLSLPSNPSSPLPPLSISTSTSFSPLSLGVKDGNKELNLPPPRSRRNSIENTARKYKKNKNTNSTSGKEIETVPILTDK